MLPKPQAELSAPDDDVQPIDFGAAEADIFATAVVSVRVHLTAYERSADVRISTLSWWEWQRFEAEIPNPAIPQTLAGANGSKQPNPFDVTYQAKLSAVTEERKYRRLALALTKAGNTVPGTTLEEQAKFLRTHLEAGFALALMDFLYEAASGGKVKAQERSETFPPGRTENPPDLRASGLGAERVLQPSSVGANGTDGLRVAPGTPD